MFLYLMFISLAASDSIDPDCISIHVNSINLFSAFLFSSLNTLNKYGILKRQLLIATEWRINILSLVLFFILHRKVRKSSQVMIRSQNVGHISRTTGFLFVLVFGFFVYLFKHLWQNILQLRWNSISAYFISIFKEIILVHHT